MTSTRRIATIVGVLFLTQTLAFIAAEQILTAVLKRPDYLTGLSGDTGALTIGQPLTSADSIESAADAGDLALINLGPGAVIVGTISGN